MLLTGTARRTSARRAGLNSAGGFTDTKGPESCCSSDLLYLRVYSSSYSGFQVFVRTNVYGTIISMPSNKADRARGWIARAICGLCRGDELWPAQSRFSEEPASSAAT